MLSVWECAAEEELNGNWVNNQEQELLNVILVKGEDNVILLFIFQGNFLDFIFSM